MAGGFVGVGVFGVAKKDDADGGFRSLLNEVCRVEVDRREVKGAFLALSASDEKDLAIRERRRARDIGISGNVAPELYLQGVCQFRPDVGEFNPSVAAARIPNEWKTPEVPSA